MKVLLIGSGGREHALAAGMIKDKTLTKLYVAPGNPGIEQLASLEKIECVPIASDNFDELVIFSINNQIDLVVIGPEKPLVAGLADKLREKSIKVFGPSAIAAQIEGSKDFAKKVMQKAGVPTAESFTCENENEIDSALAYFSKFNQPFVVKDDGLAAGKGVVVTQSKDEAKRHALSCQRVVIEKYLAGPEFSLFGISDGKKVVGMHPAQDFKRVFDNDEGPNTGGMGSYSPLDWLPKDIVAKVEKEILQPIISTLNEMGMPFIGLLYAGLVLTDERIKVIEFNARFGDPETQSLIPRLNTPLVQLFDQAASGELASEIKLDWSNEYAVSVVLASEGYPENPVLNREIELPATTYFDSQSTFIFHSGTNIDSGKLVSSGGRTLTISALGENLNEARARAYQVLKQIRLEKSHYRTDIAARVMNHWENKGE